MFLAVKIPLATSAWRPPSMVPAGPPTKGKPMVLTTASTGTASAFRVGLLPFDLPFAACSLVLVSRSRTYAETENAEFWES